MFMQLKAEIASLQKKLEAHQAMLATHEEDIEVLVNCLKGFGPVTVDLRLYPSLTVKPVQIIAREIQKGGLHILTPSGS